LCKFLVPGALKPASTLFVFWAKFGMIVWLGVVGGHWPAMSQHPSAQSLTVLAWNVYLLPDLLAVPDEKRWRAEQIAVALNKTDADVLVLSELFGDELSLLVLSRLSERYPFRSGVVAAGHSVWVGGRPTFESGGVVVLSRFPLENMSEIVFSQAADMDLFARKGALYAAVNKNGKRYHIVATHTQANAENRGIRESQFRELAAFLKELAPPEEDPVIIAGDLNVDFHDEEAFSNALAILRASPPSFAETARGPYSYDPETNPLAAAASDTNELLDYVLISARHQQPCLFKSDILPMTDRHIGSKPEGDRIYLSDHHAVKSRMAFGGRPCRKPHHK